MMICIIRSGIGYLPKLGVDTNELKKGCGILWMSIHLTSKDDSAAVIRYDQDEHLQFDCNNMCLKYDEPSKKAI